MPSVLHAAVGSQEGPEMKIHWNRLTLAATAALALVLPMAWPALRAQTAAPAGSEPTTPAQLTASGDVENASLSFPGRTQAPPARDREREKRTRR